MVERGRAKEQPAADRQCEARVVVSRLKNGFFSIARPQTGDNAGLARGLF